MREIRKGQAQRGKGMTGGVFLGEAGKVTTAEAVAEAFPAPEIPVTITSCLPAG